MTAVAGHNRIFARVLALVGTNMLILLPSLATGLGLLNDELPLQAPMKISCLILFLAAINFAAVIMIEPYRRYLSGLSLPAIICMIAVVFLYMVLESLKPLFPALDFGWLTPLAVAAGALIYGAIFTDKNIPLKCLLSLDSIALMFLWSLGAADRFTMPF